MKNILLTLFLLISLNGICQLNGTVIDKETNKPVPYANIWIENEDIGTTSDINGNFGLKEDHLNKNLVVSALGFESQVVTIDSSFLEIVLIPKVYQISEVTVKPNKRRSEIKISQLNLFGSYEGVLEPCIFARYFPYKHEYENTPFIKSIKLKTLSKKTKSCFNLRFMNVKENGEPGDDLLQDNLIVNVKRGRNRVIIDGFKSPVEFPKDGLFVAIEFLIIQENAVKLNGRDVKTGEKFRVTGYMPFIGSQEIKKNINGWIYYNGKWLNNDFGQILRDKYENDKNYCIAMEVVLSN